MLTVVFNGKPTHHKIKSPPNGGPLQVNKQSYGGAASVRSLVKALAKPCDGWPVVLLLPGKSTPPTDTDADNVCKTCYTNSSTYTRAMIRSSIDRCMLGYSSQIDI